MAATQGDRIFQECNKRRSRRENERSCNGEEHLGEHPTQVPTTQEKGKCRPQSQQRFGPVRVDFVHSVVNFRILELNSMYLVLGVKQRKHPYSSVAV